MDNNKNIQEIINSRNEMIEKQKELCLISIERINTGIKELLKNDFGTMLVKNTIYTKISAEFPYCQQL